MVKQQHTSRYVDKHDCICVHVFGYLYLYLCTCICVFAQEYGEGAGIHACLAQQIEFVSD